MIFETWVDYLAFLEEEPEITQLHLVFGLSVALDF